MATVFRKTFTKPLPAGAETFTRKGERFAKWKDSKGKARTASLTTSKDGQDRIISKAGTFTAKYRDGAGVVRETATGCRDETAARQILADLERRAELVSAGVMTAGEDAAAGHQQTPLGEHFDAYLDKLAAEGTSPEHRQNVRRCLKRVTAEGGLTRLGELTRGALEKWLATNARAGMGARTRNLHRACAVAFCNWCVQTARLATNPLAKVSKADEKVDRRRQRRAMTEDELRRLLYVATRRPLAEYGRLSVQKDKAEVKGTRDTWKAAPLTLDDLPAAIERARDRLKDNPAFLAKLQWRGRQRALVYKTLVLTGLRRKELASLTVAQLELDGKVAYAVLDASDDKSREGSEIPLRSDLADDLRLYGLPTSWRPPGAIVGLLTGNRCL